jgi:hypothetical protein
VEEGGVIESLISGLPLALSTLGMLTSSDAGTLGALGVALALVSGALLLASILALDVPDPGASSPVHPARAIDLSSPLSQSDPDAAGHSRPRAPGIAAPAA